MLVQVPGFNSEDNEAEPDGLPAGFVNPVTFEQLWLPEDLPLPVARAAIGLVIKNGAPRYIFPTIETTVVADQTCWHNRGLNSLPLAKTWLPIADVPFESLRISCYSSDLPLSSESRDDEPNSDGAESAGLAEDAADQSEATAVEWAAELRLTQVDEALSSLMATLADAPPELGEGFQFLITPLDDACGLLPPNTLRPGRRVRLFLSDVDATPTALDPNDRESWIWSRGETDVSVFAVPGGGKSDFLPDVYKPLYRASSTPL